MAQNIEFYIPSSFRKNHRWITPHLRGKVIELSQAPKKSD